ncbi:CARDB domain-containing protein [Methanobrevibacter filiformis]|uniref:DUF11 domain-containing protein n=1 Tax=Methanobrevibacter filiformis TaxID=55758 RepID=A0A166AL89_9EURY|nr:CARDB domain-containing protein [Methanobrevibacter filiformis]KZX12183.1 hypothetical protein MBFIL_12090 [Methanobrevibacter filiformis]
MTLGSVTITLINNTFDSLDLAIKYSTITTFSENINSTFIKCVRSGFEDPAKINIVTNVSANYVEKGGTVIFTINIINDGGLVGKDILVNNILPKGFTILSSSITEGNLVDNLGVIDSLGVKGSIFLVLVGKSTDGGTYQFQPFVLYEDGININPKSTNSLPKSIVVEPIDVKISILAPTAVLGSVSKFTITLKDKNSVKIANEKLQVTINGKTRTLTTNSNGIVTTTDNLKKGKYNINVKLPATNNYKQSSANISHKVTAPDLKILKIKKSGNDYKVTINNIGDTISKVTKVKIAYLNKYKIANVKAIKAGKSVTVTVKFFKYNIHKKYKKTATVNYDKLFKEPSYTNNIKRFK